MGIRGFEGIGNERTVALVEGGTGLHPTRTVVSTARSLRAAGYVVVVVTSNPNSLAASSKACPRVIATDTTGYQGVLGNLDPRPVAVLPSSDVVLRALDLPGARLVDKDALHRLAASADVPTPPTQTFDDGDALRAAAASLPYPVVVKPAIGKPAMRADGPVQIEAFLRHVRDGRIVVQPLLSGGVIGVAGVAREGRTIGVVHQVALRAWPSASGSTSAAVTIDPDPALEASVARLVADHDGIFQAQFLDGLLIDLNLRPYGSIALATRAGANLPAIWVGLSEGRDPGTVRARAGVYYRWLEGDVRLLRSRLARSPKSAARLAWEWRPRIGTAHSDPWTLTDLGPARARIRQLRSGS